VRLPWGCPIGIDPGESIGRAIVALNVLDLPTCEAIWRLLDDDAICADIGANIGHMTSLMAARLGTGGMIHAFEPVPWLAGSLDRHARQWAKLTGAKMSVHVKAVSDRDGVAELLVPADFARNHGTASLNARTDHPSAQRLPVECCTLDTFFAEGTPAPALLKVDVEGGEASVFRGAERLLSRGAIRDIIFEELQPQPSEAESLLRKHGYTLFRVARGVLRPHLLPPRATVRRELDLPTFLATREPARATARFAPIGWQCLHPGRLARGEKA
jgi:FkbM family methyltransferase